MVVGNYIKIIDTGKIYTTYKTMFEKLGFRDPDKKKDCKKGEKGTIFVITKHLTNEDYTLYGIELDSGKQILIGEKGVIRLKDKIHELW